MSNILVVAPSATLADSIDRYVRHVEGISTQTLIASSSYRADKQPANRWILNTFRQISDWVGNCISEGDPLRYICVFDVGVPVRLDQLDPLDSLNPPAALVAMLVLAFPEIHWVFVGAEGVENDSENGAHVFHTSDDLDSIIKLHQRDFSTLFDGTGLRDSIRQRIKQNKEAAPIRTRPKIALAVDDEKAYAFFNAYTAYRFGLRSHAVCSHELLQHLAGESSPRQEDDVEVVFEDVYLKFPDRDPLDAESLSSLEVRDRKFPRLKAAKYRVFVTRGNTRLEGRKRAKENRAHCAKLRKQGHWNRTLYKPYAGIFDLWKRSRLAKALVKTRIRDERSRLTKFQLWISSMVRGYVSEAHCFDSTTNQDERSEGGHGAPGRVLEIAELLIDRAELVLQSAITVPHAIRGALLALEAHELLGNQTPTVSLEALALKHQLEVKAECMFYGVERNFDVSERMREFRRDIASIGKWFDRKVRNRAVLNARRGITDLMILQFRESNQFDEELACLKHARSLWCTAKPLWSRVLLRYPILLLNSLPLYVFATVFWILGFGLLYYWINPGTGSLSEWQIYSALTFLGLGIPESYTFVAGPTLSRTMACAITAEIAFAILHLGVLASQVYSFISRR